MKRALVALALVLVLGLGRSASGDPFTAHFDDLRGGLDARVAALDPPPNRAGRAQRRAATGALKQIALTSETLTRDFVMAKRVERKLRRPFRADEELDGLIDDVVAALRDDLLDRVSLLEDVAIFDTANTRLATFGLNAVDKASTLVTRADGAARRPRAITFLLRASRIVDTAVARLNDGPLARDLTGRYIGFYDLSEQIGDCAYFHAGDAVITLRQTGKGASVSGRAAMTDFERLDSDCFFVGTQNRQGDLAATFDGEELTGTVTLSGRDYDFVATVDGDTIDGEFTSGGEGTFSASRQ